MTIKNAQYINDDNGNQCSIKVTTIDGIEMFVPLTFTNTHYAEIMRQVEAGELTIEEAT